MSTTDSRDCHCTKSELALFDPRPMQSVMDNAQWTDVHPLNNVKNSDGPIIFNVGGSPDHYIDLNDTQLFLKIKVNKGATGKLAQADDIAPVNNILHSLFSDIQLKIGDRVVEGGVNMYPYRAYLNNLLMFSDDVKKEQLTLSGFFKDTAGKFESNTENEGHTARKALVAESKSFEMLGPLCLDFFSQNKYLLSQVGMNLRLTRNSPSFYMFSKTAALRNCTVQIEEAVLYLRMVKVSPDTILEHERMLGSQNALYPVQRTEMITHTIAAGSTSSIKEGLFRGQMPKLIILGLVDNDAFNGTLATNPFEFKSNNLKNVALYRNGECVPYRPFTPDFTNKLCVREYMSIYQSMELFNRNDSIGITFEDYVKGGYTLFAFNLAPDLTISGYAQPYQVGNLRLELSFNEALTKSINVVAMAVFDARVEITRQRQVILDYKN